jgi:hypothetical protein
MNSVSEVYPLRQQIAQDSIRYVFISKGFRKIVKAVEYEYVERFRGRALYNLGFGNYDFVKHELVDDQVSNNGDQYKIFNTVLSSVLLFFKIRAKAMIMVRGSDSIPEFILQCRKSCEKNCAPNSCKKAGQRIRIYRGFVDKHFAQLEKNYLFWGSQGFDSKVGIELYKVGKAYEALFFIKKILPLSHEK